MPLDPQTQFDQHLLEIIESSPTGIPPATPAHQEALARLIAAHQVYHSADHREGYVTVHALTQLPSFHAENLEDVMAGKAEESTLESDESIYDRYVASLSEELRDEAEETRSMAVGRKLLHRSKHDGNIVHDPIHSLFLIPGCGPHPGLPGNYLHGSIFQDHVDNLAGAWAVHIHDRDDGAATIAVPTRDDALEKLQELLASAPFLLSELDALDFKMN